MKTIIQIFNVIQYNILVIVSNDYNINLFRIEKNRDNLEISFIGRLFGHLNLIMAAYYSE